MKILCLGGSYTGLHLARSFPQEHEVAFLSRKAVQLRQQGFECYRAGDPSRGPFDLILDTVPARLGQEGKLLDPPYLNEVDSILERSPEARFVHISSTSVYSLGFSASDLSELPTFDESSQPLPETPGGMQRWLLEQRIAGLYSPITVVRSAGIYGPGRSLLVSFGKGDFRRASSGNKVVSRIHVHDLCRLVLAAAGRDDLPLLHAVDRRPAPNQEVFAYLEELLGIRIPGSWRDQPPFGRRIASLHAEDLLGEYAYPTFREGFQELFERER